MPGLGLLLFSLSFNWLILEYFSLLNQEYNCQIFGTNLQESFLSYMIRIREITLFILPRVKDRITDIVRHDVYKMVVLTQKMEKMSGGVNDIEGIKQYIKNEYGKTSQDAQIQLYAALTPKIKYLVEEGSSILKTFRRLRSMKHVQPNIPDNIYEFIKLSDLELMQLAFK